MAAGAPYMSAMTIIYTRAPKRQRRPKPKPVASAVPAIVTLPGKRGPRKPVELPEDPEADAHVAAWFARNMRPPGA